MSAPSFTYSGNVYTGASAGSVDFPLTSTEGNAIGYLERSHIHVYKSADQGATWTERARPGDWDFVTNGTVARLTTGIATGEWVKVQRITPSDTSYITFQASSLLTAEQLNDDTLFNTYINQERYDQGEESAALATAASNAAVAATTAATAATTAANNANSTAAAATTAANNATAAATAATAASTAATTAASQASTDAATAISTANAASTDAATALSTANAASTTANQAAAAVSNAVLFDLIANVGAIPASPSDNTYVEVGDSTGIESFTPLAGLPATFTGDAGLTVRLRYTTAGSTWNYLSYFANDPETRYEPIGSGGSGVTAENDQAIVSDYTLATGKNASSVGPVSIDAGVTVTISANSTWVIF
jgi:hypothetical protein